MSLKKISDSTREYYRTMHTLAEDSTDMPFDNSGIEHAVAVMTAMLKYSKEKVCIYASTFDGTISNYEEYYSAFIGALKNDVKIELLLDIDPKKLEEPSSEVIKYVKDNKKSIANLFNISIADNSFKEKVKAITVNNEEIYFALGDNRMVRIENDNIGHKAPYCNFNDTETNKVLKNLFNDGFQNGTVFNF